MESLIEKNPICLKCLNELRLIKLDYDTYIFCCDTCQSSVRIKVKGTLCKFCMHPMGVACYQAPVRLVCPNCSNVEIEKPMNWKSLSIFNDRNDI